MEVCALRKERGGLGAVRRAAGGRVSRVARALRAPDSGAASGRLRPPQAAVGRATPLLPAEDALLLARVLLQHRGFPMDPLLVGMGRGGPAEDSPRWSGRPGRWPRAAEADSPRAWPPVLAHTPRRPEGPLTLEIPRPPLWGACP